MREARATCSWCNAAVGDSADGAEALLFCDSDCFVASAEARAEQVRLQIESRAARLAGVTAGAAATVGREPSNVVPLRRLA